mmetsp:Transcript_30790/g.31998  ORF Transcript_30790/g.31998 Transcript_30790/m.31998 type:complete len:148 (+) Transcript_30790:1369-1812(+)
MRTLSGIFMNILPEELLLEKVFSIYLDWLSDPVYAIRKEGARIVNEYIKKFPACLDKVFWKCGQLKSSQTYLLKVSLAYFLECLTLDSQNIKIVENHFIPLVLELAKSNVSNVVINCEKTIQNLLHITKVKDESQFILSMINKYKNQ